MNNPYLARISLSVVLAFNLSVCHAPGVKAKEPNVMKHVVCSRDIAAGSVIKDEWLRQVIERVTDDRVPRKPELIETKDQAVGYLAKHALASGSNITWSDLAPQSKRYP